MLEHPQPARQKKLVTATPNLKFEAQLAHLSSENRTGCFVLFGFGFGLVCLVRFALVWFVFFCNVLIDN